VKQPLLAHPARILMGIHWGGNVSKHVDYISDAAMLFERITLERLVDELAEPSPLGLKVAPEAVAKTWKQVLENEREPITKSELFDEEETMVLNEIGFSAYRLALCLSVSSTDSMELVTITDFKRNKLTKYPCLAGIRDDRPVWLLMPRTRIR
jgi:hypothetical protein